MLNFKLIGKEILKDKWNNFVFEFKVYASIFGLPLFGFILYALIVYNEYFRGVL